MMTLAILSLAASFVALGLSVLTFARQSQARALAQQALDLAQQMSVDPAGAGGPRPKPAGSEAPDMEAQAAGGPRPKV